MTLDYAALGLKVGLEIHRQIESYKLFCHCPSELRERQPDFVLRRELRAVSSEQYEEDTVAAFEKGKKKYACYEGFQDVCCLVELDEEPVHRINQNALRTVLQVCKMMHMTVVDQVHVMRKQVLDYSNTSGFQRTALIAQHGELQTPHGAVGVQSICLEEDSARKMQTTDTHVVYRLDRLGIPLIEIATAPDMHHPQHVQEVAQQIGMMLKSVGKFKSGIGTIRQDVNISIKGHPRVELKGVQDLKLIPLIVEQEVKRQMKNIQHGAAVSEVRNVKPDGTSHFLRPMPGAARMYVETDHPPFLVQDLYHAVEVPELLTEKIATLTRTYRLPESLARSLVEEHKLDVFHRILTETKANEPLIAHTLIEIPKEIHARYEKEGADTSRLQEKDFVFVLYHHARGDIGKEAIFQILLDAAKGHVPRLDQYRAVSDAILERELADMMRKEKGAPANALMGMIMKKYKGRVDGKKVMTILQRLKSS